MNPPVSMSVTAATIYGIQDLLTAVLFAVFLPFESLEFLRVVAQNSFHPVIGAFHPFETLSLLHRPSF